MLISDNLFFPKFKYSNFLKLTFSNKPKISIEKDYADEVKNIYF